MERFAVIIPDRGDRPELSKFCLRQIERMTLKPEKTFHINHRPLSGMFDLVDRIKTGVYLAKEAGFNLVFIIENDDWYPADYFEQFNNKYADFYGCEETVYYNIRNRSWNKYTHFGRSSLFCTGFKIHSLDSFKWPENTPFLDIKLWEHAYRLNKQFIPKERLKAIGIKHNLGLCAGKGHKIVLKHNDSDLIHLRNLIDDESFEFYRSLMGKFQSVKV